MSGHARSSYDKVRSVQVTLVQDKISQVRTGQDRSGQVRSRSGQVKVSSSPVRSD